MAGDAVNTLLEKAKAVKAVHGNSKDVNGERLELAIAFANRLIRPDQAAAALGVRRNSVNSLLGSLLLSAIRRGECRIEKVTR